jgi:hypothetical protein
MNDLNGNGAKIANSVILTLVSRGAMIMATAALPIAGWFLQRSVNTIDTMSTKIDTIHDQIIETGASIRLIEMNQTGQDRLLVDHEQRVRILESINRARLLPIPAPP